MLATSLLLTASVLSCCALGAGLVGSRAYAAKCKDNGDNILAMLQADMISYRREGEGIQNGYPNRCVRARGTPFFWGGVIWFFWNAVKKLHARRPVHRK